MEDDTEKSHEPTPKKLEDARKKGEIARSTDLQVSAAYGGFFLVAASIGASALGQLANGLTGFLEQPDQLLKTIEDRTPDVLIGHLLWLTIRSTWAWFMLPALAVLLAVILQRSLLFTPSKLALKPDRLNPIKNAKNKFGRSGLFEFFKSFVKLLLYSICLTLFVSTRLPTIINSIQVDPALVTSELLRISLEFIALVLVIATVIGVVDYLWQRQEHIRKNMMSRKDLMDETKESEGDPHFKQTRRQRGQEIAMTQMMADVPRADVVIVNPTHYAVALMWSREPGAAPTCVAKGVDETAKRIRQIAQESAVPIHSDPPTARALHATVDIGVEIPTEHFAAVAAAIRFSDAIRKRARGEK